MKTRVFHLALVTGALVWGVAACSNIVGIKDLPNGDGGTGDDDGTGRGGSGSGSGGSGSGSGGGSSSSGGSGSGGGSGSSSGSTGAATSPFIGLWTLTSGSNTVSCTGSAPVTSNDSSTEPLQIGAGSTSDVIIGACDFGANVTSTDVVTLLGGQQCSGTIDNGTVEVTILPSNGSTFTVDSSGTTATLSYVGNIIDDNTEQECGYSETDHYTKQ